MEKAFKKELSLIHIYFRDYLNANLPKRKEYERLKTELAAQYPHDLGTYYEGKKDFYAKILKEAFDLSLIHICIMVLCHGSVTGIVDAKTTTKEKIGLMMTGSIREEA